jgi:hypothetical protein
LGEAWSLYLQTWSAFQFNRAVLPPKALARVLLHLTRTGAHQRTALGKLRGLELEKEEQEQLIALGEEPVDIPPRQKEDFDRRLEKLAVEKLSKHGRELTEEERARLAANVRDPLGDAQAHKDWKAGMEKAHDSSIRPSAFTRDDSNIDREAEGMAPLTKEDDVQSEHTELLRQIAANTAAMAKDVAAVRQILADYDAGRITRDERDRRISQWVN